MQRHRNVTGLIAALGVTAALLGSCGSDKGDAAKSSTTPAPTTQPPTTQPPTTDTTGAPTDFRTKTFVPAFTVHLPGGWTVEERDVDLAQLYLKCSGCSHLGEENGEITIGREFSSLTPAKAAADLAANQTGEAGEIEAAEVASHTGTHFSITRPGTGQLAFTKTGYHTEPTGDPVDVYFIDVNGQTLNIVVDSHKATGTAATTFHQTAAEILQSLKFEA
jgi:hypothetical protein